MSSGTSPRSATCAASSFAGATRPIILWYPGILILLFALFLAVLRDPARVLVERGELVFPSRFFWVLATLVTGLLGFALCWVMHHSTLAPAETRMTRSERREARRS